MTTTITDTIRTTPNTLFGADLSQFSGTVDFASLKNDGVKWLYLRAYGSSHATGGDTKFESFIPLAHAQGIPTGAYFYAMPQNNTLADAKSQADLFINKMKNGYSGGFGDLIPMLDLEDNSAVVPSSSLNTLTMPLNDLLNWANNFRNYFEDTTGARLGLYTGAYFVETQRNNFNEGITQQGNILKDMPAWFAAYTKYGYTKCLTPGGWTNPVAWQYSEDGIFAGVPSNKTDLSLAYLPFVLNSQRVIMKQNDLVDTKTNTTENTTENNGVTTTIITTTTTITKTTQSTKQYI